MFGRDQPAIIGREPLIAIPERTVCIHPTTRRRQRHLEIPPTLKPCPRSGLTTPPRGAAFKGLLPAFWRCADDSNHI